jgi:NHLM bacteriocin system ABC transporter peptidase/ATP-binding protein
MTVNQEEVRGLEARIRTIAARLRGWLERDRRVRTPTVLQMEAVECGAASLATILAHYGRFVSLEQLRVDCGVSRDGSNAGNLLKAARKYGLKAKGFRKSIDGMRSLPMPAVVFWNFDHFLVVEGIGQDKVYLNDPAAGPRTVSAQEFDESYTGVVLVFEPGPDFEPGGQKPSLTRTLRKRLAGSETGLAYVFIASLALVITGLVFPVIVGFFIDNVLVKNDTQWIYPLLFGMAVIAVIRAILTWLQQHYLLRLQMKIALSSTSQFISHVLLLPAQFFTQRYAGDISSRVQINNRVSELLTGQLATAAINVLLIILYALLMFRINALLTTIAIATAILNLATLRWVARRRVDINRRLQQERGKLLATSMGGLQRIETIKATGAESDFFTRWAGYHAKVVNAEQELGVASRLLGAIPPVLVALANIAVLVLGSIQIINGDLTVGMLVAFQGLMFGFTGPVRQLVNLGSRLQEAEADVNRLDDVLGYQIDPHASLTSTNGSSANGRTKLSGTIDLQGITFGYSRLDPPLIEDFNLHLAPGSRVALVGESGSGKSTVARIIAGLYEAWDGAISFDGKPREAFPRPVVSNSLALVDQDIAMFDGTITENLTLWDASVPEANVLQAAKDARIHDDILERPDGYNALVQEGGRNFSGGQRQRLELARSLVVDPSILILDEATSALDPVTEKEIDESLRRRGCTCIIVAHRLSTIRDCDEIVVLERGKVVQRGTHEEMKDVDGPYARLIRAH